MSKKVDYKLLDYNKRCIDCNSPLKVNLVSKRPFANRCYCCWNIFIGKSIVKKLRTKGLVTKEIVINYVKTKFSKF